MSEIHNYKKQLQEFIGFVKPVTTEHEPIRVDNQHVDGGHLVTDDLEDITSRFSAGMAGFLRL